MDDTIINFDQLQDEINEAERYLREEVLRTKSQGYGRSFRSSKEKRNTSDSESQMATGPRIDITPTASATTTPRKYANPESREKLLNRLMSEHGSKQSTPGSSRGSSTLHTGMFGSGNNTFNQDDFGSSRLVSNYGSRISSPSLSQSSTPHHDANSNDSFGGHYETSGGGGDEDKFFKTVKKYSNNNIDAPHTEETLFFACDVIGSPSHPDNTPPMTDSNHMLTHRDMEGKLLSTLYAGEHEADYLASHVIRSSPPPPPPGGHNRSRSSSPRAGRDTQSTRTQASPSLAHSNFKSTISKDNTHDQATEGGGRKVLRSKEEVIAEAEKKFKHQHTFKPKLELSKYKKKSGSGKEGGSVDRIDAMIQVHGQSLANRERQKIELERSKLEQNCSFKPQLSKGTQQIMRQKAKEFGTAENQQGGSGDNVDAVAASERLFRQAGKHQVQQRMLKHQLDEAQNSECTFQPAVNQTSTSMVGDCVEQRPLYERVGDVQRQQAMSRQVLLECYEEADNEKLTLNPEINDKSRRMVDKCRHLDASSEEHSNPLDPTDVGTRLMNEARNQLNRKYRLIEERERELASNVKNPALCRGSQRYVTNNPNIR